MRLSQTDAIKVTDANYRTAQKAERAAAVELAKSLAVEIGVSQDAAVVCASWLERIVATPEDVEADDDVNVNKASAASRKTEFAKRAIKMQQTHTANSAR